VPPTSSTQPARPTTAPSASIARLEPTVAPTTPATTVRVRTPVLLPLQVAPASHQDSYDRDVDFGGWIDVHGCENTRAVLLIRDSTAPVTFTTSHRCTVKTGRWVDPWSGFTTANAHDLQIDHTVPLANAWASGAWSWSHAQRVAYANDLTDPDHLVPIEAAENEAKSDDGPDAWRPPARSAWCHYAQVWDRIKVKWHLTATKGEWDALREMAATCAG